MLRESSYYLINEYAVNLGLQSMALARVFTGWFLVNSVVNTCVLCFWRDGVSERVNGTSAQKGYLVPFKVYTMDNIYVQMEHKQTEKYNKQNVH